MKEDGWIRISLVIAGALLILISFTACEQTKYDLLDPDSAGQWELFTSSNSGLPGNSIFDIVKDENDNLWVTCYGKGAARYNNGIWEAYTTTNSNILNNYVTALAPTQDGNVLIGTEAGLSMRSSTGSWYFYVDGSVSYMSISTLKVASDGSYWIGTVDQGYYYYTTSTGFKHYLPATGFDVNVIEEGSNGNMWLGTDRGLYKYTGTHLSPASSPAFTKLNGLSNNMVTSLFFDKEERLWIGYLKGKTASWLDKSGTIHQLNLMNGADSTTVWDICEDRKGDIWFATSGFGLIRFDGVIPHSYKAYNAPDNIKDQINDFFTSIGEDKDGNMWFGLASKGVLKYTLPIE
jgi:ligand-binding sensor domain-containing protein